MRTALWLAVVMVVGCGKGSPTTGGGPGGAADLVSTLPQTLTVRYQGLNAAEWGRQLLDADERTGMTAAFALDNIGDEGLRFALRGIADSRDDVRIRSLDTALNLGSARKYPKVFEPVLAKLLTDKVPLIRGTAAVKIMFAEFTSLTAAVEEAAARETDPTAKRRMTEAAERLRAKTP